MSMEEMVDAFNRIRINHNIGLDEMIQRLSWLVDNEVDGEDDEEVCQNFSDDIVCDPRDPERRFYYLDRRDFSMFNVFLKVAIEQKKKEENKESV